MKEVKVVIGANFGDEGKGTMTDYICSISKNPLVIRFNSGAQAGHTVVTEDGRHHIFGHFGSGSFLNAPTFLSKYFVVNPITFLKERGELLKSNTIPAVYVDKDCLITTPYDMLLNQIAEITRGDKKHGSCGLGFNETLIRSKNEKYCLTIADIIKENIDEFLLTIKEEYVPKRLAELGIYNLEEEFVEFLNSGSILDSFLLDIAEFKENITVGDFRSTIANFDTLVFEGAQGLMLHQNYKYFPHVTPSNTGIENVMELLDLQYKNNKEELSIEVIYVTRSYLTRHGAGPLPGELDTMPYENIEDLTNVPNKFQGTLRFAFLDLNILKDNILKDFNIKIATGYNIKKAIAITCLDQIEGKANYIKNNKCISDSIENFIGDVVNILDFDSVYLKYGRKRNDIRLLSNI